MLETKNLVTSGRITDGAERDRGGGEKRLRLTKVKKLSSIGLGCVASFLNFPHQIPFFLERCTVQSRDSNPIPTHSAPSYAHHSSLANCLPGRRAAGCPLIPSSSLEPPFRSNKGKSSSIKQNHLPSYVKTKTKRSKRRQRHAEALMAKLHKFKLLATQCAAPAAVASPSRSPAPSFRLRRRRTLLGLLGGGGGGSARRQQSPGKPPLPPDRPAEKRALLSHSLADLFVASPPPPVAATVEGARDEPVGVARRSGFDIVAAGARAAGVPRFVSRSLRYRLLRRTWRPVLVAIPE
ncbi:uncharacterized protein LOC122004611 [Zingiber officinale]|uniref:uncharacterized protein LOC122004611 n=1 Tax=Zingiber officinale TaxID=94328 RepID=UPI001C4CC548|nr:uncharacterized protein LOC122004611 [Zingiber officinale]